MNRALHPSSTGAVAAVAVARADVVALLVVVLLPPDEAQRLPTSTTDVPPNSCATTRRAQTRPRPPGGGIMRRHRSGVPMLLRHEMGDRSYHYQLPRRATHALTHSLITHYIRSRRPHETVKKPREKARPCKHAHATMLSATFYMLSPCFEFRSTKLRIALLKR